MDYSSNNIMKAIFGLHLTLISLGMVGYWNPDSYLFYNLIFLLTILWSIHKKDDAEPLQITMTVSLVALFLDIIIFTGYYPTRGSGEKFSFAIAIINLMLRPVSLFFMWRICSERLGLDASNFFSTGNNVAGMSGRNTYEDIGN